MKKEVLNEASRPEILHRILSLQPGSLPRWGKFTVSEMMFHCTTIHNSILGNEQNAHTPTLKQRLLRTLVLKVMKELPKGIKTSPKYLKPAEDTTAFEEARNQLIDTVNKLADRREPIYGTHPFFGPMNTINWRRFIYMHLDHHLRQFGV